MYRERTAIALAMLLAVGSLLAAEPAKSLVPTGSPKTLTIPTFGFFGEAVCDASGNVFFHIDSSAFDNIEVFELTRSGESGILYRLPPELNRKHHFANFTVTPTGAVYVLSETVEGFYALEFNSDGSFKRETLLEGTARSTNGELAVFERSGSFIVSGSFSDYAPENLRGKNYVSIFNSSGKKMTTIGGSLAKAEVNSKGPNFMEGALTVGDDGEAYFLTGTEVLVVGESGEIRQRFPFWKYSKGAVATKLQVSGGLIAISFIIPGESHSISREFLIIDNSLGKEYGRYKPSSELGDNELCFNRGEGFTFLNRDDAQHWVKITAALR